MPRLAAFGRLALLDDDGPLAGAAARGRNLALLALLARAGETGVTREKLAAYLWPESDTDRSRHSLDQALYTLRRALGANAFAMGATTVALDHRVLASDVVEFTRAFEAGAMRQAVELYAGPFLDGFHLSGSAEFERWVDAERAALHAQYVAALEALAQKAAAADDPAGAAALWRRLAAAEPLSSRVALELMRALANSGDRAAALNAAAVHTALVREELDAAPDPAITTYMEELRREPEVASATATAPAGDRAVFADGAVGPRATPRQADAAPAGDVAATPSPVASANDAHADARPSRRTRLWAGVAFAGVALVTSGVLLAPRVSTEDPALRRVAVARFQNETGDASLDPIGRMAADWIIDGLVRTGLVQVIEPDAVGRTAEGMVSGRVYLAGDTVWLRAAITRPESGVVLRALDAVAAPVARPTAALEPLRQQVLGALGTLYDSRLAALAETALRPPSYAAYQAFAAGLEMHAMPRDLAGAAERFRRAAQLDPQYVMPRLWLAWASILGGELARADSVTRALTADRARMSPLERAWHDRIAALLAGDNEASYRAARRMVEIAPRSVWVIALANTAVDTNRPSVAVAALEEAGIASLGLERHHGWFLLTFAYHMLGEYARELEATERAIRSDGLGWGLAGPGVPALAALGRFDALERRLDELRDLPALEDGVPRGIAALLTAVLELRAHGFEQQAAALADRRLPRERKLTLASAHAGPALWAKLQLLYELGRWEEAQRMLAEVPPVSDEGGGLRQRAMAGLLAARRGDAAAARSVFAELATIDEPFLFGEPAFWRARIAAVLGEAESAVALLRRAFAKGQGDRAWHWLHVGRDFDALRSLKAFQKIVLPRR